MIREVIENIEVDFKKAIFNNYRLKNGLYIKFGKNTQYFIYKYDKKEELSLGFKDLDGNIKSDEYEWFVKRDYYSNLLTMDKPVDSKKKVHSNNIYSFFVKFKEWKKENFEIFENYFETLKTYEKFLKSKIEREIFKPYKDYIFSAKREETIEQNRDKIFKLFDKIKSVADELNLKKSEFEIFYIKVFFDTELDDYQKESEIYYALKIYNKNKYIYLIDNKIYGMSGFNLSVADKKPFLKHKTRGFELPFLVDRNEVFIQKDFFDFLLYNPKKEYEFFPTKDKSGLYLRHTFSKDVSQEVITDFDILVLGNELKKPFVYKNYLNLKKDGQVVKDRKIFNTNELFMFLDDVLYNGQLKNNLYDEVYSKLSNRFQQLIYLTRDIAKNIKKGFVDLKTLNKFSFDFVDYYLRKGDVFKAKEVANFYFSVKEYEGESMNILKTLDGIEEKVLNLTELNEDEFFILAGQVIMYLLQKSEKKDKKADMIEPFLRAGKSKKLKDEIEVLYFKYKHAIPLNFQKLNNGIALLMAFEKELKLKDYKDKLLLGILSENIFYRKDEK
ncbi:hypothetical protein JCM11957_05200 [Caminibacter profundus]